MIYSIGQEIKQCETFQSMKIRHGQEVNDFEGIFFAFSNEQLKEGMDKVGVTDTDLIYNLGAGCYIRRDRSPEFKAMFKRHGVERSDRLKDEKTLIAALVYELANHEYCITGDPEAALNSLGLDVETVDKVMLKKAIKIHNEGVNNV